MKCEAKNYTTVNCVWVHFLFLTFYESFNLEFSIFILETLASMYENEYESQVANGTDDKNEVMNEVATDLDPTVVKNKLCRLCRLPKIGSSLVRPNGLRGCKCDEVLRHHNHDSSFPSTNLGDENPVPISPKKSHFPHHPEINITENLACSKNEICPQTNSGFVPPQGMDAGEYPKALFYQYYPNRNKSYTFNLLPLPFAERLNYQERRTLSIENADVGEKWKNFLYNLPDSQFQSIPYPDDKFCRWKNYLRHMPDDNRTDFRKKMQVGPKYDSVGRLPITGEELKIFRVFGGMREKPKILRKGDGIRKDEPHKIIPKRC